MTEQEAFIRLCDAKRRVHRAYQDGVSDSELRIEERLLAKAQDDYKAIKTT